MVRDGVLDGQDLLRLTSDGRGSGAAPPPEQSPRRPHTKIRDQLAGRQPDLRSYLSGERKQALPMVKWPGRERLSPARYRLRLEVSVLDTPRQAARIASGPRTSL